MGSLELVVCCCKEKEDEFQGEIEDKSVRKAAVECFADNQGPKGKKLMA